MTALPAKTRMATHDLWFERTVWPALQRLHFGECSYTSMAQSKRPAGQAMDVSGVDVLILSRATGGAAIGLQSRIQFDVPYETFTVRSRIPTGNPTEFDHLRAAVSGAQIGPQWFSQAYICGGELRALFLAPVSALVAALMANLTNVRRNSSDGNEFHWVSYQDVIGCRYLIRSDHTLLASADGWRQGFVIAPGKVVDER